MANQFLALVSLILAFSTIGFAYKPVFFLHGLGSGASAFSRSIQALQALHPGTIAFSLPIYEYGSSAYY